MNHPEPDLSMAWVPKDRRKGTFIVIAGLDPAIHH
jgi:hypothetical protein